MDIDFFQQLESAGTSPVFQHDRERERESLVEKNSSRWACQSSDPSGSDPNDFGYKHFISLELQDEHKKRDPQLGASMASKTNLFHVFNSYVPSVLEIYSDLKPL